VAPFVVIAYGNPLRCDDGLAWAAAEELKRIRFSDPPAILTCLQLTPELASLVSTAETVVFMDASRAGEPGTVSSEEILARKESSIFTHEFSPAAILALSQQLYGKRPTRAVSLSMSGKCFDHGEQLSDAVRESLPRLVTNLRNLVDETARLR
jgi:hydrogenase maturation protease